MSGSWIDGERAYAKEDLLRASTTAEPFHIGQGYEHEVASVQECARCSGTSFEVAFGDYFTAVRCVACRWEHGVHEG